MISIEHEELQDFEIDKSGSIENDGKNE